MKKYCRKVLLSVSLFIISVHALSKPLKVSSSSKEILEDELELRIRGSGYDHSDILEFLPVGLSAAPIQDKDFHIKLIDGSGVIIQLFPEKKWAQLPESQTSPVALILNEVRSDSTSVNKLDQPVIVAMVVNEKIKDAERRKKEDNSAAISEKSDNSVNYGVTNRNNAVNVADLGEIIKVYQSALSQPIYIIGQGFPMNSQLSLILDPALRQDEDFKVDVQSPNVIKLSLQPSKRWRTGTGHVMLKEMKMQSNSYLIPGKGVWLSKVLMDPLVSQSDLPIELSQGIIEIKGFGFTSLTDTNIMLSPTSVEAYEIIRVSKDIIKVKLKSGHKWLPPYLPVTKSVPLRVVGIDTGAGFITFPTAVTVGKIIPDSKKGDDKNAHDLSTSTVLEITGSDLMSKANSLDIDSMVSRSDLKDGRDYDISVLRNDKIIMRISDRIQWQIAPKDSNQSPSSAVVLIIEGIFLTALIIVSCILGYVMYARFYRGMPLSMAPMVVSTMYNKYRREFAEHLA